MKLIVCLVPIVAKLQGPLYTEKTSKEFINIWRMKFVGFESKISQELTKIMIKFCKIYLVFPE